MCGTLQGMSDSSHHITPQTVAHVAQLANLPLSNQEQAAFTQAFDSTLTEINRLLELDVSTVAPTHHTTGLQNVWREDVVQTERVLTQEQALSQAAHTWNGYVVVDRVLEEEV